MVERCLGHNRDGSPCSAAPQSANAYCLWHDPARAADRAEWRRRGGQGRSHLSRAGKRIPKTHRDVQEALLRALAAVEAGELEPARATALATLARAFLAVAEAGELEARLTELERRAEAAAGTGRTA